MKGVLDVLCHNIPSRFWFHSHRPSELSIVWDDAENELRCRARIDIDKVFRNERMADLNTTKDAPNF